MDFDASKAPEEGRADFPKFELSKDEVARVNLLTTKDWAVTVRHFVYGMGYIHCHAMMKAKDIDDLAKIQEEAGRPDECILCKMVDEGNDRVTAPRRQFAMRLLRYKTDLQGRAEKVMNFWMEIWIYDNWKYKTIQGILTEWGGEKRSNIREHDIAITCTDPKYQKMTIQPLKTALWKQDKGKVLEYMKEKWGAHKLSECLASVLDEDALKRRFSQASRRTETATPPDFPYGKQTDDEPVPGSAEEKDPFDFSGKDTEEKTEDDSSGDIPPAATEKEKQEGDFLDELLEDNE